LLSVVGGLRRRYNHSEAGFRPDLIGYRHGRRTNYRRRTGATWTSWRASPERPQPNRSSAHSLDGRWDRLRLLCATLLLRSYPRLAKPPLNLDPDELLSAVVDRLLKALRKVHPTTVRQFFALANRHMRWELNDLARRLDKETPALMLPEGLIAGPDTSESQLSPNTLRCWKRSKVCPRKNAKSLI